MSRNRAGQSVRGGGIGPLAGPFFSGQRVGTTAEAVALADLDGDLDLDMAVAGNSAGTTLFVFLSQGGVFVPAGQFGPYSGNQTLYTEVIARDFDSDGDNDVAYLSIDTLFILQNQGGANFLLHDQETVASLAQSLSAGDFDADGDLDLVATNSWLVQGTVSVLLNDGSAGFGPQTEYAAGLLLPSKVASDDLDGDGDLDLAVASEDDDVVTLLLGAGDGTFAAPLTVPVPGGANSLNLADMDGDGDIDMVVAQSALNQVTVLPNDGSASFGPASSRYAGQTPQASSSVDMDGDGDVDVVVAGSGFSSGNPRIPQIRVLVNDGIGVLATSFTMAGPYEPLSIACGDTDGDGRPDVALCDGNGVQVQRNTGDGSLETLRPTGVVGEFVASADLDADGSPDLLAVLGSATVLLNHGDATFTGHDYPTASSASCATIADLDLDGDRDLVIGSSPLSVLANDGHGNFGPYAPYPTLGLGCRESAAAGDLDGDGYPDVVFALPCTGKIFGAANDGAGGFGFSHLFAAGPQARSITLADVDGDGDLDMLVGNAAFQDGSLSLLRNEGGGTFLPFVRFAQPFEAGALACTDLDTDGDLDIATSNTQQTLTLFNDGAGVFATGGAYAVGGGALLVGDLDRDGDPDLVSSKLALLKNAGTGGFSLITQYAVGYSTSIALADFDGDLDRDVALSSDFGIIQNLDQIFLLMNLRH